MNNASIQPKAKWYKGKHLYIIIVAFFLFYFYTLLSSGSTNSVIPAICGMRGWNESTVLFGITIAGYVGAIATLLFGQMAAKKGAKFVSCTCVIVCGVLIGVWGVTKSMGVFIACIVVMTALAYGFQTASCPVLISGWFPRTKGIVLGWATMGIVAVDLTWSQYIPGLMGRFGIDKVMLVTGAVYVVFGIIMALTIHNFPEEEGRFPDNLEAGADEVREVGQALAQYKTPWTFKKCAKTKEIWQIVFGWALLIMIAVCFISRLVPRCLTLGYDMPFALQVLGVSAACALLGSWFFGFLDEKLGTRKASLIYTVLNFVMWILCLMMPLGTAFIWIASIGIMFGIGGIYNLIVSMAITKFGRWDFVGANRFIGFCQAILVSSSFALNAIFMNSPLGFTGLYAFCLIISVVCFVIIYKTNSEMIGKKG